MNEKVSDGKRCFWATNILLQNDRQELIHGAKLTKDILNEMFFLDELLSFKKLIGHIEGNKLVKKVLTVKSKINKEYYYLIDNGFLQKFILPIYQLLEAYIAGDYDSKRLFSIYTVSFSTEVEFDGVRLAGGDRLNQWRAYGDQGTGYSLGIMSSDIALKDNSGLVKVIYKDSEKHEALRSVIRVMADEYTLLNGQNIDKLNSNYDKYLERYFEAIFLYCLRFKEEGFVEEKEVRYFEWVYNDDKSIKREFKKSNNNLVDFIRVNFENNSEWVLTSGPAKDPESHKHFEMSEDFIREFYKVDKIKCYSSKLPFK